MIKIVQAKPLDDFKIELQFSDGSQGIFDAAELLQQSGSLLEPLRTQEFFGRFFLELGALCWPNGLELSPSAIHAELQQAGRLSTTKAAA